MPRFLVYLIYNLLFPFFLLLGLPGYIVKGVRRGGLRRNFVQRFGFLPREVRSIRGKTLWIHAVSVGEVLVAGKIIRALRELEPTRPIILSTTTTTGFKVAEKDLPVDENIHVIHNPVDLPGIVGSVVRQINPERVVLVESEIWPNLVMHLKRRGIPVLLANARLSPRSEVRYLQAKTFVAPVFSLIDRTGVPFEADVDRWTTLGIPRETISVFGSVKFDESESAVPVEKMEELTGWLADNGCDGDRPIFLAGSTHAGEELICARVYRRLKAKYPDLALVVVPRHAERAPDIEKDLQDLNLLPVFRTHPSHRAPSLDEDGEVIDPAGYDDYVYVSDTTGELRAWFYLAEVVFIGKSLAGRGGQNPVEPILAGRPVIVGPHMQNFREVVDDLIAKAGIISVENEVTLAIEVDNLLGSKTERELVAAAGKTAMEFHHGAAMRTAEWILEAES